jgi:hypothetical protein
MEALGSSETSVLASAKRRNISEDAILHSHRRENLKSYQRRSNPQCPTDGSHCQTDEDSSFDTTYFHKLYIGSNLIRVYDVLCLLPLKDYSDTEQKADTEFFVEFLMDITSVSKDRDNTGITWRHFIRRISDWV